MLIIHIDINIFNISLVPPAYDPHLLHMRHLVGQQLITWKHLLKLGHSKEARNTKQKTRTAHLASMCRKKQLGTKQ